MVILIVWIASIRLEQKTNLSLIKKLCENKDFCGVVVPSDDTRH